MKIKGLFLFLFAILVGSSCSEERDLSYQGGDVVEFSNPITGMNEKTTGPSIGGKSREGDNPDIPIKGNQDSIIVQLVGSQKDSPINVQYSITEGTAVEGVDFSIIGDRGVVTIPANSSSTAIRFEMMNRSLDPTEVRDVSFTIVSVDDEAVEVSENYDNFVVNIFPMLAYVDVTVSGSEPYFSTRTGESFPGIPSTQTVDIAFDFSSDQLSLVSPYILSGDATASDTKYSGRVFAPPSDAPDHLLAAYATDQLGDITAEDIDGIPISGTTTGAAVNDDVEIQENGIYGFVNGDGKKGYIRIKSMGSGNIVFDIMVQP